MTRTSYGTILVATALGFFAGCGSSGEDHDAGPRTDANGQQESTPIMNRQVGGTYTCAVTRDRTSHAPRSWTGRAALQHLADGTIHLPRVEWEYRTSGLLGPTERVFLTSRFALDGSLGDPASIPNDNADFIHALTSAPRGDGFAVVWADEQALRFVAFDANGAMVVAPKTIATPAIDSQIQLSMAADRAGDGFALALTERNQEKLEPRALFLDRDGNARNPLRALATTPTTATSYHFPSPYVAAATNGYVFVWNDPAGKSGRMLFMKTDTSGTEIVAPRAISFTDDAAVSVGRGGFGFERPGPRIVEMNGAFVAAWSEGRAGVTPPGDFSPTKGGGAVVRLTRLDSTGSPTGTSALLRAHEDDVDEVEPVLTPLDNALAVSWSRGTHIYICGGCVPDHRIDLVVIDPNTLDPLSQLVTVTNGGEPGAGGLLRKQTAISGSSLLMLYDLTFHTWTTPGSLVYTCTP